MAVIDFTRATPLGVVEAWNRLTAFAEHGRFVPLTTVTVIDQNAPGGGGFVARTSLAGLGLAGVGFDDVNVLEVWRPPTPDEPGVCQLRKTGRWVRGWARLTVSAVDAGSLVRWQETIRLRGVPRSAAPLVATVGERMFGSVVDGLLR